MWSPRHLDHTNALGSKQRTATSLMIRLMASQHSEEQTQLRLYSRLLASNCCSWRGSHSYPQAPGESVPYGGSQSHCRPDQMNENNERCQIIKNSFPVQGEKDIKWPGSDHLGSQPSWSPSLPDASCHLRKKMRDTDTVAKTAAGCPINIITIKNKVISRRNLYSKNYLNDESIHKKISVPSDGSVRILNTHTQ